MNGLAIPADWEFADADTSFLTHDIHRYSGKFVPPIARCAIELLTVPGALVVDPYVGSGTTLLEAALTGRRAVGIDLSPLAVLISRVKTSAISPVRLADFHGYMREVCAQLESTSSLLAPPNDWRELRDAAHDDPRADHEWFEKWFQREVLDDLLVIDQALRRWPDQVAADAGRVAFSNVLRRSSRAHSGYPNVMFDRNAPNKPRPARVFVSSLAKVLESVSQLDGLIEDIPAVIRGDAASLPLDDGVADAVVSHPPYIGSIPYAEYGVLSLMWLGHDPKALDRRLTGGRRQSKDVVARFAKSYGGMLAESARILKPRGCMFLMVGSPTVRGEIVDLARMTKEVAPQVGLELVGEASRSGMNRRANKMGGENLLFLMKS
jgi:site-specific DNA-methyltransferase (cytosine-N4-specific)